MKLELQASSLPHCHKMPSRYFEANAQPEHHSNGYVAICIVEHFNQKDYTMYANCKQVLLKGTLGKLVLQNVDQLCEFYAKFDSDTLRIQLSISRVLKQFQAR